MAFALSLEVLLATGARRTFRRLARAVRVFEEEGDRVFGVSYQGEFMADKLLAGFTLARVSRPDLAPSRLAPRSRARRYDVVVLCVPANSWVRVTSVLGVPVRTKVAKCEGDMDTYFQMSPARGQAPLGDEAQARLSPPRYFQMSHEARVTSDGSGVITVKQSPRALADFGAPSVELDGLTADYFFDDAIALYDFASDNLTTLYRLSDYFDPVHNVVRDGRNSYSVSNVTCNRTTDRHIIDWFHVSSISEGFKR